MSDKKNECTVCGKITNTAHGLSIHRSKMHRPVKPRPYVLPPPPPLKKEVTYVSPELPEMLSLMNGGSLNAGDTFFQVRKFIVRKITKRTDTSAVEVEAECIRRVWQRHEPTII